MSQNGCHPYPVQLPATRQHNRCRIRWTKPYKSNPCLGSDGVQLWIRRSLVQRNFEKASMSEALHAPCSFFTVYLHVLSDWKGLEVNWIFKVCPDSPGHGKYYCRIPIQASNFLLMRACKRRSPFSKLFHMGEGFLLAS